MFNCLPDLSSYFPLKPNTQTFGGLIVLGDSTLAFQKWRLSPMSSALELDQVEELISQKMIVTSSVYSNRLDQLILRKANDLDWSTTKQTGDSHNNRHTVFTIIMYSNRQAWANSIDQDETPQNAASHLGLHCLPLIQQFLDTTSGSELYWFKF